LVVDHNHDSRFLLVKSLHRKFPAAIIRETGDGEEALLIAERNGLAAIITHRTQEYFGTELVQKFREVNPTVPIVMVSGIERTGPALAAGATRFLLYDEWLRVGTVVREALEARAPKIIELDLDRSGEAEAAAN
jgi:DNA-binding NtrC family response regulator